MTPEEHYDKISTLFHQLYEALQNCADETEDLHAEEVFGHVAEVQAIWLDEN